MDELKVVNVKLVRERSLYSQEEIRTPGDAVRVAAEELKYYDREVFCILNMDVKGRVLNMSIVSVGILYASLVDPREVFKSAILSNAACIIAIHNHPSGICQPSQEDITVTRRLLAGGQILGIELKDHVIVGAYTGEMYSFREETDIFEERLRLEDVVGVKKEKKPEKCR